MKEPTDGWDLDEREALQPIGGELAVLRERHANDPSVDLLRAAQADALPPDLQARVSEHLTASEWSRALVSGANDVEHSLDAAASDRLLARITKSATARPSWSSSIRLASRLLAAAAAVIVIAALWVSRRGIAPASPAPPAAERTVAGNAPPPFELPLQKPDVRLSVAALTYRGTPAPSSLVDDLASPLDAFRAADYARSAQALQPLEAKYPAAIEPPYYRGLSLLFMNDAAGAIAELQKAARLADDTFSADVIWYLAVAQQRAGRIADARAGLDTLCRTPNPHTSAACDGLTKLGSSR